jgi:predicted kinase
MKTAIICVGISASGKSTFAKSWVNSVDQLAIGVDRVEINRDTIRQNFVELGGKEWCWDNWSWKREKEVTFIANSQIDFSIEKGCDIICSDTNLNPTFRNEMIKKFEDAGYLVEIKPFPISYEDAIKRDNKRANGVGSSVIAKQFKQWEYFISRKKYVVPDERYTNCILVDLDGTLCHMDGKRGAFEWDKVGGDSCDEHVKDIINRMPETEIVILLSGRDSCCRKMTEQWLEDNEVNYDHLYMRTEKDMRPDYIVKEELFWKHIADKYVVKYAIDDRPIIGRLWRSLGIKVFQVGDPHIEF